MTFKAELLPHTMLAGDNTSKGCNCLVLIFLLMGFAASLSSEPKPEIMLAIDFRCPFCATFWTSKK